ncbi:gamma-glutamylcyclotransferase [Phragmitibacter flavus]|uniref:Gamma-glutamylcyclotransferase family protein n=1 Tax=Phragmitibacter flavus TaxID=2576071 RepID=A0A5R8KCX0_9BACT|nr:gamma-glutamylcyclotransferase [Phragmitibacter flavus]TLD70148.1 gamma-glutamylcyclotransferase [Phragmitibacter flavus]
MKSPQQVLVFVYGTLKRGLENGHYLTGQKFLGEARTQPLYRMASFGGYPGMYPVSESESENGLAIHGEVWSIDETTRARLDLLEDLAVGLYTFDPVKLAPPFDTVEVHAYFYAWPIQNRPDAGDHWPPA